MTGASNRTVAKIATAALEDFGLVSVDNAVNVVDKNKIRRELQKKRKHVQEKATEERKVIEGIYFDGRKDQTMIQMEGRRIAKQEEHVALIEEPASRYFGHLSINPPVNAVNIATNILSYMKENTVNPKNLKAIGCDGTNVNTGWKGGVIRIIEVQIGKPLQ